MHKKNDFIDNLPQLIVALDGADDKSNYVHILDVKEDATYYCPCCKGPVKSRALESKKMQPHFYHISGTKNCSEETYVHYICQNWLFEQGCKFIVGETEYEVATVETENTTLHTSFGDYRPDIIVHTTDSKTFYFEIKVSNKKTFDYVPKWDELGNDVVEVDARYFINQKYENNTPVFDLIYSNGVCFIKKYSNSDYEEYIAKRKLYWKRQEKLDYKIYWERLDWFWTILQKYCSENASFAEVVKSFKNVDIEDKETCFDLLRKMSCIKENLQPFRDIINEESIAYWYQNSPALIGHDVQFDIVKLEPRKDIEISYRFRDKAGKLHRTLRYYSHNREWVLGISKIKDAILGISDQINEENRKIAFYEAVISVLVDVRKRLLDKNTIWKCDEKYHSYRHDELVGIVSYIRLNFEYPSCNYKKKMRFRFDTYSAEYEETGVSMHEFCWKIITNAISELKEQIAKYDGKHSNQRIIFITSGETLYD